MDFFGWLPTLINLYFPWMSVLWEAWGVQLLVLFGFFIQVVLAIFGSRRRFATGMPIRFVVWSCYLLAGYVAAIALGKLTVLKIHNPSEPNYITELKGLLAPLVLMQLGNPDSISAYSVEDNRLGVRQVLNLLFTVAFVVWVLIRCWDTSTAASLYFPMFVVGIIKYGETVWALSSVYDEGSSITLQYLKDEDTFSRQFASLPEDIPGLTNFLKAYYRFECLKPHLVNWLYHPIFAHKDWLSVEGCSPDDTFAITDIELGFMYDVLYTKSPVLYTKLGLLLRFVGFACLILSTIGFSLIFGNLFFIDLNIAYTESLLIAVCLLEIYEVAGLPFSDWVIVKLIKHHEHPYIRRSLQFLVKHSLRKKRWSNKIRQFNLLGYCLRDWWPAPIKLLKFFGKGEVLRRFISCAEEAVPPYLKELIVEDMEKLDRQRGLQPFTERGKWTLEIRPDRSSLQWSIDTDFDKSIILWHLATDVFHSLFPEESKHCQGSKFISDYMMFLVAEQPDVLSLSTTEITFQAAYSKIKKFLKLDSVGGDKMKAQEILSCAVPLQQTESEPIMETIITRGWDNVEGTRRIVTALREVQDPWEVISSVWVEMLCYTAYNCQLYQHTNLLRHGGDILTHVWLLLSHSTDKFNTLRRQQTRVLAISDSLSC